MKKNFTIFTVLYFISQSAFAQFTKGQKLIGGNVSFSTSSGSFDGSSFNNSNINNTSNTGIGADISKAKFISPKTLLGIGLAYGYYRYVVDQQAPANNNNYKYTSHSGGVNVFAQRFISLGNNFFFTILTGGTIGYNYSKQTDFTSKAILKAKGYSINANITPGLSYKINDRFLFDAFLSNFIFAYFQHTDATSNYPQPQEEKTHRNNFYISTSLSNTSLGNVGLGFRWLLRNK